MKHAKSKNQKAGRSKVANMEKKTLVAADKLMSAEKRALRPKVRKARARNEPIAVSHVTPYKTPTTRMAKGGTVFAHTDAVADIGSGPIGNNGTISFNLDEYDINPGLASVFLWAAPLVSQYEMYEVEYMEFIWNPNIPTTVTGDVILAFDPDPFNTPPTSSMQMKQMTHSVSGSAYKVFRLRIPKSAFANKKKFVRTDNDPSPTDPDAVKQYEDIRLVDAGKFYIARIGVQTDAGTPISDLGTWSIKYSIRASSMKEKTGPQTSPLNLQLYTSNSDYTNVFQDAQVQYDGSYSHLQLSNPNNVSHLTFDAQYQQPVSFNMVVVSPEVGGVINAPTLMFNGQTLGPNDYEFVVQSYGGQNTKMFIRGQFIVLPVDEISPNDFSIDFRNTGDGLQKFLLTMGSTEYPFIPVSNNAYLAGQLSTIPLNQSYRLRQIMKKNKWTIPKVTKEPPKFVPIAQSPSVVLTEKSFPHPIGDKFVLPDIEDLAKPTKLEKALQDSAKAKLVRISSQSRLGSPRPKLYNINETMQNAMSFAEIAQQHPWVTTCDEPLRIPALASLLSDQQMSKVGAALGSNENNTFQEILNTVSQVTEIGTKIFSLFG